MNLHIYIQARMGSTRLPGKVLRPLMGRPMIQHIIERVQNGSSVKKTVVLTSVNQSDDALQRFCEKQGIEVFRGSEENVLERYYLAAKKYKPEVICRITGDCPVIDSQVLEAMAEKFKTLPTDHGEIHYLSNTLERTFPRGLDAEFFSMKCLEETYRQAHLPHQLEHVTPYIYENPQLFKLTNFKNNRDLSSLRLTVDTPEDFQLIEQIYKALWKENQTFYLDDIVNIMNKNPVWSKINEHVAQKKW